MLRSGAATASSAGDQTTIALRRRAFLSHEAGQLKLAELLYREVLGRYPDDVQIALALGVLALQTQRYEWALHLLTEVYRVDQSAAVNDYMGNALCGLNRLPEALHFHELALALEPAHASAQLNRAQVLRSLAQLEETSLDDNARASEVQVQSAQPPPVAAAVAIETAPQPVPDLIDTVPVVVAVVEIAPQLKDSAPAAADIAQDVGENARVAAETALATSARALAATEGAEYMLAAGDSVPTGERTTDTRRWSTALNRAVWRVEQDRLAPMAVSVVLALLLCAEVVHAAKIVIWHEAPQPFQAPPSALNRARPTSLDVAGIAASHLFGEMPNVQDALMAPRSTANLKLTGTFATADPRHGWAIIGDAAKSHVYSIGDAFGDVSLAAIYKDRVVITRNGTMESLFLPRTDNRDQSSIRAISPAVVAIASPAARATEDEPLINRYANSNPETDASGSLLGIRVVPGKDREAFANSGLIGGDIVVALNGMKLDSESGQDTWKQAGSGSTVTVLRRGVMKEVTLNFSP